MDVSYSYLVIGFVIMLYFPQLGKCVQMLSSDVDGLRDVICVLVEMHAACMSRHSVQRTLARYILHVLVFSKSKSHAVRPLLQLYKPTQTQDGCK